ncbi:MAG: alpha-hydroxy-acid oxidizing protein, partial [SAR116 cluster bacterium]|nr:alpha-hydroxy-acid oxidizing protein [SAR116 cluster bacterium]
GLGAGGRAGGTRVLEILHKALDLTMALCGRSNLSEVDDSILLK